MDALSTVFSPVSWATDKAHKAIASATNERTADVVGDLATMALTKGGAEARQAMTGAAGKSLIRIAVWWRKVARRIKRCFR